MGLTFKQFEAKFPSDDACLEYIFNLKYGSQYSCPKCKQTGKWHMLRNRRAYACQTAKCGYHLYPCKETPFHKSRTSLKSWFYAIYLFSTSRHGVPAKELERQLGVTYKCAWRMGHEIRQYMDRLNNAGNKPFSGVIEADETYYGSTKDWQECNKAKIFGIVQRDGNIKTQVVFDTTKETLGTIIEQQVEKGSTVYTDEYQSYKHLSSKGYEHDTVNHSKKEYARGKVSTNTIEGSFFHLKRCIKGSHIHVSKHHLPKYGAEFDYRYNRRKKPDSILHDLLVGL